MTNTAAVHASPHLLTIDAFTPDDLAALIARGLEFARRGDAWRRVLSGRTIGLYFRHTSTRTRTSFLVAAARLGADVADLHPSRLQTMTGESIEDTAIVLAGYLDALVVRSTDDELRRFSSQSQLPIVNAMGDSEHPTQAIADLITLQEQFGRLEGLRVLYVGEGNNTAAALALAASRVPRARLTIVTPPGYEVAASILERSRAAAAASGADIQTTTDVDAAPRGVDVVYTTRWETTGTHKAFADWRERFAGFTVTRELMARVSKPSGTVFMHDLPAVRGQDVESAVLDGPQSVAVRQAHNKLYAAMVALEHCTLAADRAGARRF